MLQYRFTTQNYSYMEQWRTYSRCAKSQSRLLLQPLTFKLQTTTDNNIRQVQMTDNGCSNATLERVSTNNDAVEEQ